MLRGENMNACKVGFLGHREMYDSLAKERILTRVIEELASSNDSVEFLVGRSGDFDELAAIVVRTLRREMGGAGMFLTLVLPYVVANIECYEKYYDDIVIPEEVAFIHPKQAYVRRNEWIVEHSDILIVNVERNSGGAYRAMRYAERLGKKIINISSIKEQ